ncbi:MAG: putative glycolipid-binding domain-containing protein [Desulfobacterales bacterium]
MMTDPNRNDPVAESVLWRGLVLPGHESCRLFADASRWHLEGTAVISQKRQPCRLDYLIVCDKDWRTLSASVEGWIGTTAIDIRIATDPARHWWLNGIEKPAVTGCIDIDLNFSPSTNLLPIRRLNLAVGETAAVNAAWLRFPSFKLEPLPQQYRRMGETAYRYESAGGRFVADLKVNRSGFVLDYPGIWQSEATSEG